MPGARFVNFKSIANADMATVARWLREGFAWWVAELADLLPRDWQRHLLRGPAPVVDLCDGELRVRGQGDDAPLPRSAIVVLPPQAVLVRSLDLPVLSSADTRRIVALDIDRLTPFHADRVAFDVEIGDRDPETGRQAVLLGVLPNLAVEDTIARARERGVEPASIAVDAEGAPRFDFLRAYRLGGRATADGRRAGMWWAAAGALAAANLLLLIYRDEAGLDSLRDTVESQQTTVAVASRLRHKIDLESIRRTALMQRAQETPLRALAAVSAALPNSAWTDRFEWNRKSVHIAGYQRGAAPILRALEQSPALKGAHALTAAPAAQSGIAGFDIAADLQPEAHR